MLWARIYALDYVMSGELGLLRDGSLRSAGRTGSPRLMQRPPRRRTAVEAEPEGHEAVRGAERELDGVRVLLAVL